MIILHVSYSCKPGTRDTVLAEAKACAEATSKEEGNIFYKQFPSPDNDTDVFVVECWESKEALGKHSKTPHYIAFGEFRKPFLVPESYKLNVYAAEQLKM